MTSFELQISGARGTRPDQLSRDKCQSFGDIFDVGVTTN